METKKRAVALGLFDGVHLGHRAVLDLALEQKKNGLQPAVFTFNPTAVLRKTSGQDGYIYTHIHKYNMLAEYGFLCNIYSVQFEELCGMSGEEFAKNILAKKMNAKIVCCGNNFRFGKNASCGVEDLRRFGERYGFEVHTAEPVKINDITVSSGEIRRCLVSGEIERANTFLGMPYKICNTVVHGNEIGRTINFPTLNQEYSKGQLVLKYGVYFTTTYINKIKYKSITNIGVKPTIAGKRTPLAETHILDFAGDLYGKNIMVEFHKFIRPEMKFSSVEELKEQISKDIAVVREIL
ncbi:MAG: bifunctional riboflavin kinase/FAD synthetase [Prevotella sp.]|nr:bifunctional riboflavin kinase/FAD synthetase [Alistipes senegalensis]MCM1357533.1 bifunctional riboflavin kinase/FAD synthetase [Prevotella sp.]MCM1472895.1 bifunctional riboflavin kinase/FAD synthetase [Muribaculaceae bacterium]